MANANTASQEMKPKRTALQNWGLGLGVLALILICIMPQPEGLPIAGQRMLGILVFAIIVWMTEAVSYPVSATMIAALMALLLGFGPDWAKPETMLGTKKALSLALSGYSSSAWALVSAAMFISVAMTKTGLDRRIALFVLSKVGAKTSRIYAGIIITGFILAFFVPSSTARIACLIPIIIGIIDNLGIDRHSLFASLLVVGAAQADTFWNISIQTAAAQNLVAVGFISSQLKTTIPWIDWLRAGLPFSLIGATIYFFLSKKLLKPEFDVLPGSDEHIRKLRENLGPMSLAEKKLLTISTILLFLWATGGKLHSIDTATSTVAAVALFFTPGIGILDWKFAQPRIGWGTIVMFGAGISLGTALLKTEAASWLAKEMVAVTHLNSAPVFMLIAIMGLFLILVHLGFASATALASSMIPIVISVLTTVESGLNVVGLTMLMQFFVCYGFILPVNSPQGMLAYNTDTFTVPQFIRTGVPITIIAYVLALIFSQTYWKWLGLITL